jgi:site-specific recombinase XerD
MDELAVVEEITKFKKFILKDYKLSTTDRYLKIVQRFLEWDARNNLHQSKSINFSIMEYLEEYCVEKPITTDFKTIRAALHLYHIYKVGTKFTLPKKEENLNEFIETEIIAYNTYLTNVIGLAEATKISHRNYLKRFLYYISPNQKVEASMITVDEVQKFFIFELSHLSPSSKNRVIGILRCYIRYLQFKDGTLNHALLSLPLRAPQWRLSNVPKTFEKIDIENILSTYDLNTAVGKRDYAIALFFTELGLRASEVASLTLDDINWREGKILIKKTKTHSERELPLSQKVGQATFQYLKDSRPRTSERTLFVRFSHRYGDAMGREQIRGTIRRAYKRAGISTAVTGTHILRHSVAKNLYENGSSLKMIADVLGHESIETTVIYTKVGRSALQPVICPWPDN